MPVTYLLCSISSAGEWRARAHRKVSLKSCQLCPYTVNNSFTGDPVQQFLEQLKVCSPGVQSPDSAYCQASILNVTNSTRVWSLQPRLPPALTPLTLSSAALVSTRSSKASHQIGPSNTWTRKLLSSTDSRNLLDCLPPTVPLSQQISGWLKPFIRTRTCKNNTSCS